MLQCMCVTDRKEGPNLVWIPGRRCFYKIGPQATWKFCNWLGMPTVGFEARILALLTKMKATNEVRGQEGGKRRKNTTSKFKKELKKVECFMNYKRTEGKQPGS